MRHWIATLLQASSALHTRRAVATHGAAFTLFGTRAFTTPALAAKRPACGDIETCRAEGERKEAELEAKYPTVRLGDGVSYKEKGKGVGNAVVENGDVLEITYAVYTGSGNYMYSLPSREPGARDGGSSYRVKMGNSPPDIPPAVERTLLGAKLGSTRLVEVVPRLGFAVSEWQPLPEGFAGKQRMERYRALLSGNGLQPGYNAVLLFEATVQNIRKAQPRV